MSRLARIPLFTAWRQTRRAGYTRQALRGDILAGLTVGIIAIPLAMALAIAVGAPPQHGLYTVLVAAPLIALSGGSRFNVSGPTAAFVVILLPIVQQHGLSGLLLCSMLAGLILIALGLLRAGRLIQFVPYPVTLGFTAGIGIVIAGLQLKDALGLSVASSATHFPEQMYDLALALPTAHAGDALVAAATLGVLIAWPRLVPKVPGHLGGAGGRHPARPAAGIRRPVGGDPRRALQLHSGRRRPRRHPALPAGLRPALATAGRRAAEPGADPRAARPGDGHRHARRHRIAALRGGRRRHERQQARLQRRADRPGPG